MAASFSTIFPGHQCLARGELLRPRLIGNKAGPYSFKSLGKRVNPARKRDMMAVLERLKLSHVKGV